jgi:hypothetical protein
MRPFPDLSEKSLIPYARRRSISAQLGGRFLCFFPDSSRRHSESRVLHPKAVNAYPMNHLQEDVTHRGTRSGWAYVLRDPARSLRPWRARVSAAASGCWHGPRATPRIECRTGTLGQGGTVRRWTPHAFAVGPTPKSRSTNSGPSSVTVARQTLRTSATTCVHSGHDPGRPVLSPVSRSISATWSTGLVPSPAGRPRGAP